MDKDLRCVEEIIARLRSRCCRVEGIGPNYRKHELENEKPVITAYECDLLDRHAIRKIARKIEDDVGGIDILVTCAGQPNQDIFDMASTTLMSHYWVNVAIMQCLFFFYNFEANFRFL